MFAALTPILLLSTWTKAAFLHSDVQAILAYTQETLSMATSAREAEGQKVYGNNPNVTYCTVTEKEQLFKAEFLDVSPAPIPTDRFFFTFLQGYAPDVPGLSEASLRLSADVEYDNGEKTHQGPLIFPLKTTAFGETAHLTIRDKQGVIGGPLQPGRNDLVLDFIILSQFMKSGVYTFKVESMLPDGRYLFCYKTTQRLEGTSW